MSQDGSIFTIGLVVGFVVGAAAAMGWAHSKTSDMSDSYIRNLKDVYKERTNDCVCGDKRECAAGFNIVGIELRKPEP